MSAKLLLLLIDKDDNTIDEFEFSDECRLSLAALDGNDRGAVLLTTVTRIHPEGKKLQTVTMQEVGYLNEVSCPDGDKLFVHSFYELEV